MNQVLEALQSAIPKAAADPLRPRYHFLPPANWMNDPNGTIFTGGEYHLFYQFNPYQAQWGRLHWGHARSADLVHWEHLPIALAPAYRLGEKYCFSGCCVERPGGAVIYYTSIGGKLGVLNAIRGAQQWAAHSSDERLIEWQRAPNNPFLKQKMHGGRKIYEWRDPYVWQEKDGWYMLLSGKYRREHYGSVFLYTSPDLQTWRFAGRLLQGQRNPGRGWECPNMLKFGERYFLLVSNYKRVIYAPGCFDGHTFSPEGWFNLDHGQAFYASNTYLDRNGEYVLVGWVKAQGNGYWNGCLSLPRRIRLDEPGALRITPIEALAALRGEHIQAQLDKANRDFPPIHGNALEIVAHFEMGSNGVAGFILEDDHEQYRITYDNASHTFECINASHPLERLAGAGELEVHIFVDHSVVEVFINQRETFTACFRPHLEPSGELRLRPILEGSSHYGDIEVWRLETEGIISPGP